MALKLIGYPSTIRRIQAPVIMRMLSVGAMDRVLDAGCGLGLFTQEIAKKCRCTGIDLGVNSSHAYAAARTQNAGYLKADLRQIPLKDGSFDRILLSSVLQMVTDDRHLLDQCNSLLKTKGVLVLSVPHNYVTVTKLNGLKTGLSRQFGVEGKGYYQPAEILALLEKCGFTVIETEYSPKLLGSLVYESWLYFCYKTGLPLYHPLYFLLLYPLAFSDRFLGKSSPGNELIIKAEKR
ncbi:MAG TPA: class I SAM-dependent methyltransferase [Methanocella sp.]